MGVDAEAALTVQDGRPQGKLGYWTPETCSTKPGGFDFVLTVDPPIQGILMREDAESAVKLGGDGTVLYASWLFQKVG
jgi:NAD kinase